MAENWDFLVALSPLCHRLHMPYRFLSFYLNDLTAPERCVWCIDQNGLFKGSSGPLREYSIILTVEDCQMVRGWYSFRTSMMQN